jgi:hypothetical protein
VTNIKIYYYVTNRENHYNDWDMLVTYGIPDPITGELIRDKDGEIIPVLPKKSDLNKKGYVLLPIPQSFWTEHKVSDKWEIYKIMNGYKNPMGRKYLGDPEGEKMQNFLKANHSHTSMSTGDVVMIGNVAYVLTDDDWVEIR